MKFALKLCLFVAAIFLSVFFAGKAVDMVSAPSDVQVGIGLTIITVALIAWLVFLGHVIKKGCRALFPPSSIGPVVVLLVGLTLLGTGCTRVRPGYAGIRIDLYGKNRGVEDYPLVTGMVWYNPFTENIDEWPCFVQTASWCASKDEGSPKNEEITFNSKEGLVIAGDISLSYQLYQDKVPAFYVKFRSDSIDAFTHGFLRNVARNAFNEVAQTMGVEEIYGAGKEALLKEVTKRVNAQVEEFGIHIEQLGFIGAMRLPQNVVDAINAKIKATQDAIRVENELRQASAEAKKKVATAEGEAQSQVARAEGEAKANDLLAKSITAEIITWRKLQIAQETIAKWDGKRPNVEGTGANLLFTLPSEK